MISQIDQLIQLLSRIPGLGPRSGRRAALHLLKHKDTLMTPLSQCLDKVAVEIKACHICHNLDVTDPCNICTHPHRDRHSLCIVTDVADLWALERAKIFKGHYHVLGGVLSAIDGISPEDLKIDQLVNRVGKNPDITEIILALNATLDGQVTAHYIQKALAIYPVTITALAHGVPLGGELDYMDDGTLNAAFTARRKVIRG